jgi:alcohol dehydrogenase YqhD (iron-dependent ADH family)
LLLYIGRFFFTLTFIRKLMRANLAWAASLALNGLTGVGLREGDFAIHRIETAMSAVFPEIAHGAGLGVLFPAWILYVKDYNAPTFARWA